MREIRFVLFGAGFWSRFQLAAWGEIPGTRCVAIVNRTRARAEALAREFGVPAVYEDPAACLAAEACDVVDIVAGEEVHAEWTLLAAAAGRDVICQKPMARSVAEAEAMVAACRAAGVRLFVHENWRFQSGLRAFGEALHRGAIGPVYRARLDMRSGFPVTRNQPYLATLERFILTDLGSHTLDTARWLFGEPSALWCRTARIQPHLRGEDVATVHLRAPTAEVTVNMSYAGNFYEIDRFPETFAFAEGALGSAELGPEATLRLTTAEGTWVRRHPPPHHPWADPRYAIVHASIVPCQAAIVSALRGGPPAETTGEDNLRTLRLVYGAYASAETGEVFSVPA